VPRARIETEEGKAREWRSKALPRYRRLTKKAEALFASVYLSGTVNVHSKLTRCDHPKMTHPRRGKAHRRAATK